VETNASYFALDRKATPEQTEEVIMMSIERLMEQDSPSLEMIKMQVDYDSTYLLEENEVQAKTKARLRMIGTHKTGILEVEMEDSSDYEALTTLYRKIFRFLLEFLPNSKVADREVEKEIAAALESVFPRVGLKAFIQLDGEAKVNQLLELARIILGIRLFNRDEGRGGAGIDNMDKDGSILANVLSQDIDREVEFFSDACAKYQKAIIKAHVIKRRKKYEKEQEEQEDKDRVDEFGHPLPPDPKAKAAAAAAAAARESAEGAEVSESMIERWSQELANRRQYLGFLRTLQDEARFLLEKISAICEKITMELNNVRSLVSNKTSVPKEVVYPRFEALGTLWLQLYEEVLTMIARSNTFQGLCNFRLSFVPTLTESYYADLPGVPEPSLTEGLVVVQLKDSKKKKVKRTTSGPPIPPVTLPAVCVAQTEESVVEVSVEGLALDSYAPTSSPVPASVEPSVVGDSEVAPSASATAPSAPSAPSASDPSALPLTEAETDFEEEEEEEEEEDLGLFAAFSSGAKLLSVDNTPDFMLLPLELQGYCPWTIVEARGLLVPGKPALGIVRFQNLYYVCDHEIALRAFLTDPESYLTQIKDRALRNPEYIHLLRLHRWFPTASIARLLKLHEMETTNKSGMPLTRDASTGTPTHFVESYIDINYHWNEWELRRRALKIVNLKNCTTSGQQTDESHFRRDMDTQVYPHRIKGTQTKRDKGVNPPTVTTYVAGLRGKQIMAMERRSNQTEVDMTADGVRGVRTEGGIPSMEDLPHMGGGLRYPDFSLVTLTVDNTSYHGYPITSKGVKEGSI
jgi:hypothetical protein